jgi:hypothetical protein
MVTKGKDTRDLIGRALGRPSAKHEAYCESLAPPPLEISPRPGGLFFILKTF